jgi:holin-like protein
MIVVFATLLLCQLGGEVLTRLAGWPLPGPVLGLALLLGVMVVRDRQPRLVPRELTDGTLETTADGLLKHLSLLFVPAGVGVVQRLDVLGAHALSLTLALVASSLLGLAVTAGTFRLMLRLGGRDGGGR